MDSRSMPADSSSRSIEIRAILITFSIVSTITVALRIYVRYKVLRSLGWDDRVMTAAQLLAIGSAVAIGLENNYGLGHHTWEQSKENYVAYMKVVSLCFHALELVLTPSQAFYASVLVYNVAMCLVKIGILLQYRRVFAIPILQALSFYGLVIMVAWTITIAFLNALICVPVAKFWNSTMPGHCTDPLTVWYVMAGFNLVTDVTVFCMPLPVIGSLNIPRRQKIMLLAIFSIGFLTCAISIYRIRTLKTAASTKDSSWDNIDAAIWSFLEVTLAIIASCLPTLRPLFSKLMPKLFASSFGRSNRPSDYGYTPTHSSQNLRSMPRLRTEDLSKDSMDDTTTLRNDEDPLSSISHRRYSRGYPGVSVSIKAERGQNQSDETQSPLEPSSPIHGGIKATTVVTQEVVVERVADDEWSHGRPSDSDATLRE
ncbi:Satratoxin biosynthesis SC1 cluster protein 4 [Fusarium oxysporum f. sp. cubense]|uniref:Satratoxin biosynthesis SC1 cluster protein 4 n=1 Tax=Fusarium oxysporum f. sp. cubense TaxID=61366 RepID=A0A559LM10_FUSOC|nr:Satratoxin biosynthesis SC1 cluster protein 4 [Fusarium oxysporum f. sp. cubense]